MFQLKMLSLIFYLFLLAPGIVVYDNACNLHTYCLNRDPKFFERTRFLVDRLHWRDHTGLQCIRSYKNFIFLTYISIYPFVKDIDISVNIFCIIFFINM